MRYALAVLVWISVSAAAQAADIPRFDVEADCTKLAQARQADMKPGPNGGTIVGAGGNSSGLSYSVSPDMLVNQIAAQCIKEEQAAYDVAQFYWQQVGAVDQDRCSAFAGKQLFYKYIYLRGCLEAPARAAEANRRPSFRY